MRKLPIITTMLVMAVVGAVFAMGQSQETPQAVSSDTALARNLNIFNTITQYLARAYVDSLRPDEAFEAAIGAMLNTVDPYTEYYNADDKETLQIMTTGAYGGIGAFILWRDGNSYISLPIVGSPSYKAGLKAGDRIVMVDTVKVEGKESSFTTKLLKGDPGTMVTVVVERPYVTDSIITFNIKREKVQDKSVPYYGVKDGIGFVKLTSFMEKSADEMKEALESFRKNPEVEGVIIDLRSNGGGLISTAVDILGMLLPRNTKVIETRGKVADSYTQYSTSSSPLLPQMPLVVLIDGESASASEITAGAIQDLDRGVLVGQRSYGKGLVQGTYTLPYDGLLKVTTAKYHLPSGRLIQALDYSHRNPDGSVARTPDSLTHEFKTVGGRIVRDGGGLVPDTLVKVPDYSRLLYNLMVTNQIFDYATKYAAEHPEIAPAGEFRVTDEIYEDFIAFVDTAKIKSDKTGERLLEELRKSAKTEGFMTEQLGASLDSLAPLLAPDLRRDLTNKREEISQFLGREIVGRYYNRAGEEEYSLQFDDEYEVAKGILKNKALYNSILKEPAGKPHASDAASKSKNKSKKKK